MINSKESFANARCRNHQQAFTLLEVVVAACVIGVSAASIFVAINMGFSMTATSRENLRATQIMVDKMEGVRLYNWTQLTNSSFLIPNFTNWYFETTNIGQVDASGNGVQYTGAVQLTPVPFTNAYYSSNMVQVTVTLNWSSSGNGWYGASNYHTRSMVTYVAMNGSGVQNPNGNQ
jgi:type II secretory pathway pseudopilin PulG